MEASTFENELFLSFHSPLLKMQCMVHDAFEKVTAFRLGKD